MRDCVTNTYTLEVQKTGISVDDDLDHDVTEAYLAYKTLTETQTVLEGKVRISIKIKSEKESK